jgi:hypothetical protein
MDGEGEVDVEGRLAWMREINEIGGPDRPFPFEGMLPIAHTEYDLGVLMLALTADDFGRVFHRGEWARSMGEPWARKKSWPSFAELLAKLGPDLDD